MRTRGRTPKAVVTTAIWVALVAAACSASDDDSASAPTSVTVLEADRPGDGARGVFADAVAPEGSPAFCRELTSRAALVELADALAGGPADAPDAADAAADALESIASPESLDASRFTGAAASLRAWADRPEDEATTNSMSAALAALGEEVQELCAFPVG